MRNMAKKRAPMFVVPVAIAFPTAATSIRQTICIDRSFVLDDVQVTNMETRNVANLVALSASAYHRVPRQRLLTQTGAVSQSVSMLPYPSVPTMEGKKYWKVWLSRLTCCRSTNKYSR